MVRSALGSVSKSVIIRVVAMGGGEMTMVTITLTKD